MRSPCHDDDDRESDLFFDSADCLSTPSEDFDAADELESSSYNSGYAVWLNEPQSVKERRQSFFQGMGLARFECWTGCPAESGTDVHRLTDSSGAVSSSFSSGTDSVQEDFVCSRRIELDTDGNCMVDESDELHFGKNSVDPGENAFSRSAPQCHLKSDLRKKRTNQWWKYLTCKRKDTNGVIVPEALRRNPRLLRLRRLKVRQHKKQWTELSGLFVGQEIQAHSGVIWTLKFSPDGQYLATGGSDGVVRVWRVMSADASLSFAATYGGGDSYHKVKKSQLRPKGKSSNDTILMPSILMPNKIFWISDSPVQEFHGHTSDVLMLDWSSSNDLLSSSKDSTVRLWKVGSDQCLNVFRHSNYVTCVQFNPCNKNYFISGSIDGKARIWGISERRVVDWADVRDVITAICYKPDGMGFAVGSVTGDCRFFETSGNQIQQASVIDIEGKKRSSHNRITSIQFSQENYQRVVISSEDGRLRVLEGSDVTSKYKGCPKLGSQTSASFTSSGKHVVSTGEDRIYLWNYDNSPLPASKSVKSLRSCECFSSEGVSVVTPWCGPYKEEPKNLSSHNVRYPSFELGHKEPGHSALGNCFLLDRPFAGTVTWPEESLPPWEVPVVEESCNLRQPEGNLASLPDTWGLVVVTGSYDGKITAFHNYGLPVRL